MNVPLLSRMGSLSPARPDRLEDSLVGLCSYPGFDLYCQGELLQALSLIRRELVLTSDDGGLWELLGVVMRDLNQPREAADAFERASLLHRIQPLSSIYLAECYALLKRVELACQLYLLQAELHAEHPELLLLIASGLDGIDKPYLALELCRRAASIDPLSGQAAYALFYYSTRCGCSFTLAKTLAWRAVELEPDNAQFRMGLASVLVRLGQSRQAACVINRGRQETMCETT